MVSASKAVLLSGTPAFCRLGDLEADAPQLLGIALGDVEAVEGNDAMFKSSADRFRQNRRSYREYPSAVPVVYVLLRIRTV